MCEDQDDMCSMMADQCPLDEDIRSQCPKTCGTCWRNKDNDETIIEISRLMIKPLTIILMTDYNNNNWQTTDADVKWIKV